MCAPLIIFKVLLCFSCSCLSLQNLVHFFSHENFCKLDIVCILLLEELGVEVFG